jgi:hypothetical protein
MKGHICQTTIRIGCDFGIHLRLEVAVLFEKLCQRVLCILDIDGRIRATRRIV